ncbi:MAG: GH32 C-terminal domain-containing protein [Bacteroidales bacterium]|nr:GH32 C-terminal domain-containing protein [Bacteroidales bacterium]
MKVIKIVALLLLVLTNNDIYGQGRNQNPVYARFNPSYHFYPSGDPTGLFYYNGLYYNAWGRFSSTDFVHWHSSEFSRSSTNARTLLADSTISQATRDSLMRIIRSSRLGGSGSIVVDENNVAGFGKNAWIAYYHNETQPYRIQVIGLSYSTDEGANWTRYAQFPILDINSREFRDPKVFWHEKTQQWILAIGWAEAPKVKFFSSTNLIDWEFMSDFGPWGATNGVWECVDFFPLPVDGDYNNIKWVIALSVQPYTGQYFIGDFDGERFILDKEFAEQLTYNDIPSGQVLFDFERGIDEWEMEGESFVESPTDISLRRQGAIMGKVGRYYVNSYNKEGRSTGKITSPTFLITKNFINFKIGGSYKPGQSCINLLIDGKIVRTETGRNASSMQWSGWNVSEYRGEYGQIQVVDNIPNGSSYVYVDHVMLCDEIRTMEPEKAYWFDYGQDFFAVRSWNNYASDENRRIWTAWMGSWRYNSLEPVRGVQSIPREVKLKYFSEGIRLVQHPIEELKNLRKRHIEIDGNIFEGIWTPRKFKPLKNVYELIVEFENISSEEFGLKICVSDDEKTTIGYKVKDELLFFDRRFSGINDFIDFHPAIFIGPMKNRYSTIKLHIFVDNCSVEVFGNDGETCISNKIYPSIESTGIEFFSNGGSVKVKSIDFYELDGGIMH